MRFKDLYEQYHNFRKNQYLFCTELEELIQREIYDFDARAYINLDKVIIKTNLRLTPSILSKFLTGYGLELTRMKTFIDDNLISQITSYEYTFKYN